jgi:hypothetical protein
MNNNKDYRYQLESKKLMGDIISVPLKWDEFKY